MCQLDYWVAQAQLYAYYRGFVGVVLQTPSGPPAVVWLPSDGLFDLSATATRIDRNNTCSATVASTNATADNNVRCALGWAILGRDHVWGGTNVWALCDTTCIFSIRCMVAVCVPTTTHPQSVQHAACLRPCCCDTCSGGRAGPGGGATADE